MLLAAVCPILLSLPDVCPVKTPEVELVLLPARPDFSFIDFCQTLQNCPHIPCGRGGGEGAAVSQPGCVCHSTLCCCCPLQSARPTVGISFGKNTSIFSLNWAWILMSDSTTRHPHYPHLIYGGWKLGKWIKEFLIKNIFILKYLESALIWRNMKKIFF